MKNLKKIRCLSVVALAFASLGALAAPPAHEDRGVLVGDKGMTLYAFDRDAAGRSACNGPCAANWPPLAAGTEAAASGDWTLVTRDDGARQWAYKGRPLYYFVRDQKAGDRNGDGMLNDQWHVARP